MERGKRILRKTCFLIFVAVCIYIAQKHILEKGLFRPRRDVVDNGTRSHDNGFLDWGRKLRVHVNQRRANRPLQPVIEEDFPTVEGKPARIPHLIHQIFDGKQVPEVYVPNIESYVENNPQWTYMFWTVAAGRELLAKYHPYLLENYDSFNHRVKQADLLKYAVLYEFGGMYSDLDVENLRPLDRLTIKYACILPTEPFEFAILFHKRPFLLCTATMLCRPKHPFMKQLLWNLQFTDPRGHPVVTTGPGFVTNEFVKYNNMVRGDMFKNKTDWDSNSPFFYKGELRETDNDAVYVPNSQYLSDALGPDNLRENGTIQKRCRDTTGLSTIDMVACNEYTARKPLRERKTFTFTVHKWHHLWLMNNRDKQKLKRTHIRQIAAKSVFYGEDS